MAFKKTIYILIVSVVMMSAIPIQIQRNTDVVSQQYTFKAVFLFRFTEYIEWKNNSESPTFNFAILGKSPITQQLRIIAGERKINQKNINVKEYSDPDDIGFCNILFIPQDCTIPIADIVSKFANKPVLIVTEKGENEAAGAHINFFISDNKLKFEINPKAANKVGIKIGSQLLQHAVISQNE